MYPSQHSNKLLSGEPSILQKDLLVDDAFLESPNFSQKRQRRSKSCPQENSGEQNRDCNVKKIVHRDIERQRRREMATLYASLRSLLPIEYIKGKRSISDQMNEAVNYVKHMERNIKELQIKKERLKKSCKSGGGRSENGISNSLNFPNCVTVNSCLNGIEILISSGLKKEDGFPLSRVLAELLETGLNTISCISNRTNDRILYRIQVQVNDLKYINLRELQQRLENAINLDQNPKLVIESMA